MWVYRVQRQPKGADLFDETSWKTVVSALDEGSADRLLDHMAASYPEYEWCWKAEVLSGRGEKT